MPREPVVITAPPATFDEVAALTGMSPERIKHLREFADSLWKKTRRKQRKKPALKRNAAAKVR